MTLQAVLAEADASWYATPDDSLATGLLERAGGRDMGRRMLARWLSTHAGALLAPNAEGEVGSAASRWPRARLLPLIRDIGVLAFAPAIRNEIRREPLRRLKAAVGSGYLLALDRTVWDGKLETPAVTRLSAQLSDALVAAGDADGRLHGLFDLQGRCELRAWAMRREPGLAAWIAITHPAEPSCAAHLPEKAMLRVYTHHETRPVG